MTYAVASLSRWRTGSPQVPLQRAERDAAVSYEEFAELGPMVGLMLGTTKIRQLMPTNVVWGEQKERLEEEQQAENERDAE